MLIKPNGAKYWRLKYRVLGKYKRLSVCIYPDISLVDARSKRKEACKVVVLDGDTSEEERVENWCS